MLATLGAWLLSLILSATALASDERGNHSHNVTATRWWLIASLVVILVLAAWPLRKVLIGTDKRMSTSKTTAATWTCLIAGALLGMVLAKFDGHRKALETIMHSGLAGQYALLIGGPLGAAIAAKGIVTNQVEANPAAKTPGTKANLLQLVQNDEGDADLGDFQYVLFNLVAIVYFIGALLQSPRAGLPHIPDLLLGLTSVSAVGYVAKKTLPIPAAAAKVSPASAAQLSKATITGKALLVGEEPQDTPLVVLFGVQPATIQSKTRANGTDTIEVVVPEGLPRDKAVEVLVILPTAVCVDAGRFRLA
jgi:hypothetical protein